MTRPIHVPTAEELIACVVRRGDTTAMRTREEIPDSASSRDAPATPKLTPKAEALLRHAADPAHWNMGMEERWAAIGVNYGSEKDRILRELYGAGVISREKKGPRRTIHVRKEGWAYLGLKPPSGMGRGGTTHRLWVQRLKSLFKRKGYDVRVEMEIGREKKRVDLVAFARDRIGIEVAMTSAKQEITNLKADLRSGVLDLVLLVSPDRVLLAEIQKRVRDDTYLCAHASRLKYYLLTEEAGK